MRFSSCIALTRMPGVFKREPIPNLRCTDFGGAISDSNGPVGRWVVAVKVVCLAVEWAEAEVEEWVVAKAEAEWVEAAEVPVAP